MSKIQLLEDIYGIQISSKNKRPLYGIKGEYVSLIEDFYTILVVENEKGERFPVKTNLTNYKNDRN